MRRAFTGWNMGFTPFKMIAMGVVNCMATSPAVVGNQQCAVQDKSHHPFNTPVGMKSVVATFVGQHPAAHGNCSCDGSVEDPERNSCKRERNSCSDANGCNLEAGGHDQTSPSFVGIELGQLGR